MPLVARLPIRCKHRTQVAEKAYIAAILYDPGLLRAELGWVLLLTRCHQGLDTPGDTPGEGRYLGVVRRRQLVELESAAGQWVWASQLSLQSSQPTVLDRNFSDQHSLLLEPLDFLRRLLATGRECKNKRLCSSTDAS